jgi:uncharacterized membrane protein
MTEFLVALTVFLVAHLAPAAPGVRPALIAVLGRATYLAGYSAISLLLLAWIVVAARNAEVVTLWDPARWQWVTPFVLMPFSLFLIVAGLMSPNPLSISLRQGEGVPEIARITRHPVLWGFILWAASHVPANGSLVPVILFVSMALFSTAGFLLLDRKARSRLGQETWLQLARGTSVVPFAALLAGGGRWPKLRPLVLPAVLSALLVLWFVLQGHRVLIGPDPLPGLLAWF